MTSTYNAPYMGDLVTPEQLFQSIPQPVTAEQVIGAAGIIAERLIGVSGLLTTNGGL